MRARRPQPGVPDTGDAKAHAQPAETCAECPLAVDRRAFLRDAAAAAVATLAAIGVAPGAAFADIVRPLAPSGAGAATRTYPVPERDGISIDAGNEVILVRWQDRAYAFSLRCPHRGKRLEWRAGERRFFCPKHKARFEPDGAHASGRRTRSLDRYDIARRGGELVIDLGALRRVDREPAAWRAAVVRLA